MSIRNLLFLRISDLQSVEEKNAQHSLALCLGHQKAYLKRASVPIAVPQVLGTLLICSATWYITHAGLMSGGMLLSFFYLFFRFAQNAALTSGTRARVIFLWKELSDLFEWWDSKFQAISNLALVAYVEGTVHEFSTSFGWELNRVGFKFEGSDQWLFRELSLQVLPGETLVITGRSGSGKSSLLNLMIGELRPQEGVVSLVDTQKWSLESTRSGLLKALGYVGPESFLFEGTIYDNLIYGLTRIPTQHEIEEALIAAECHFVGQFPEGVQHFITEQGQGLSAGQKQRLALARALLRNPKALILDEATANLDQETEARLIQGLAKLKGLLTLIVVTHRPAFLAIADRQLDLDRWGQGEKQL
jgi:ABC-type bacteriocin/lantibiotic exporter with double-glycine peptidase domain